MTQTFKVALGGRLFDQVLATAAADEVSTSEVIRRILWSHFEGEPQKGNEAAIAAEAPADSGPDSARIRPKDGPAQARRSRRSSPLPIPLPSPQGRGLPQETKATAKASVLGDLLSLESTGRVREAPTRARPGGEGGPDSALLDLGPAPAPAPAPEPPPVLWLPCRASRRGDPPAWGLSQDQIDRWQAIFSGLDVLAEARKAGAWLEANPGRWKTHRGMARFLLSWLERANDGGRFGRREASGASGGTYARRGGNGWSSAIDKPPPPAPPPKGSLREAYGRDSFEEWEAELRAGIDEPEELEKCLGDLAQLRGRWEANHAA